MDYQPKLKQARMHSDIPAHSGMEEPQLQSSSTDSDKCSFSTSASGKNSDVSSKQTPLLESLLAPASPALQLQTEFSAVEDMIQPELEDIIQPEMPHLELEDIIQPELPHLELEDMMIQPELYHLEPTPAPLQTLPESESSFQPEMKPEAEPGPDLPELDPAMLFEDNNYIFEDHCEDNSFVDGDRLLYTNAPITLHQSCVFIKNLVLILKI